MEFARTEAHALPPLRFLVLGRSVRIDCADTELRAVLAVNYAAMDEVREDDRVDLHYLIERSQQFPSFVLTRRGKKAESAKDVDDFLFLLEKEVIVELQEERPELLFLHAAALDWRGKACLLVGESGAGKSTTAWALLHHNFLYLSDELSPIDLHTLQVHAYPQALCLKDLPAPPYSLPKEVSQIGGRIRVPTAQMPSPVILGPRPLAAVFLLKYSPEHQAPTLHRLDAAKASLFLYVSVLNALAHSNSGLDAVARIAEHRPCFAVAAADLSSTCALIREAMETAVSQVEVPCTEW